MAVITNRINVQADEIIRDRIGAILKEEFDNQYLYYNTDAAIQGVWVERVTSFDQTELNAINVNIPKGDYENWQQGQMDGVFTFNIDCHTSSPSTDNTNGDVQALFALKRMLGICRYILSDPQYKTLGFAPGFIQWVRIIGYDVKQNFKDRDGLWAAALNSAMGRLTISVKAFDSNTLIVPPLLDTHISQVQLGLTPKGYMYQYGPGGGPPPLNPNFAYIVDQDDNILAAVPGGQKYTVTVIQNIIDTITNNQINIVDNIL